MPVDLVVYSEANLVATVVQVVLVDLVVYLVVSVAEVALVEPVVLEDASAVIKVAKEDPAVEEDQVVEVMADLVADKEVPMVDLPVTDVVVQAVEDKEALVAVSKKLFKVTFNKTNNSST